MTPFEYKIQNRYYRSDILFELTFHYFILFLQKNKFSIKSIQKSIQLKKNIQPSNNKIAQNTAQTIHYYYTIAYRTHKKSKKVAIEHHSSKKILIKIVLFCTKLHVFPFFRQT